MEFTLSLWGRHGENLEVFEPPLYFGLYHVIGGEANDEV
jgi:hypothetical protein